MSSILDALQKVEAAAPRRTLDLGTLPPPRARRRRTVAAIVAAFGGGALLAVAAAVLMSRRPPPVPAVPATPAPLALPAPPPLPPPAAAQGNRPWAQVDDASPAPPPPPVATAAKAPPAASADIAAPPAAPRVHVSFLLYSKVPERRSVALAVEEGALVMLHEGEQAGGVQVTRILPDRVELRHDGQTFSVRARD